MEKKRQRRRLYALLMAFFMFVTTVAGNGMSLTAQAADPDDNASVQAEENLDTATLVTSTDGLQKAAEEGKKIVLYSPAAKELLTTKAANKGLAGTKVTPSDGKLAVPDDAVRMNVTVTPSEGEATPDSYTFSYPSGEKNLYLTSGPTGNKLTFEETANE